MLANLLVWPFLAAVGLALLAYFRARPEMFPAGLTVQENADQLLPIFIVRGLPPGITGLVIAGLLAAAMSSLSSGLNSACSVITTDFIDRLLRNKGAEPSQIRLAKYVSLAAGVIVVALGALVGQVEGNLLELCYKVANLLSVPLFLLFFMAIFHLAQLPAMPAVRRTNRVIATSINILHAVDADTLPAPDCWQHFCRPGTNQARSCTVEEKRSGLDAWANQASWGRIEYQGSQLRLSLRKESLMAKFYVESGTVQMITEAEDARGAALWAVHSAMEQVLPVCPDDPLTPAEKNERIRQRGCSVLDGTIRISEQGFGRADAERFDTVEVFVEWNQLLMAVTKLERRLQVVNT